MKVKINNLTLVYEAFIEEYGLGTAFYGGFDNKLVQEAIEFHHSGGLSCDEIEYALDGDTYSTDVFIALCQFYLNDSKFKEPMTITCQYEHIIWLFHDIQHFDDCDRFDMNIQPSSEIEAIEYSIDCLIKNNISIPYYILKETCEAFYQRFRMNVDFVKYAKQLENKPEIEYLELA